MITTSNSLTHEYKVSKLHYIGKVEDNFNVVCNVSINVTSKHLFDYNCGNGFIKIKTCTAIQDYDVTLSTENLSSFVAFDDLTEDQVLNWVFEADPAAKNTIESENEAEVYYQKNTILDPLIYCKHSIVQDQLPWNVN